MQHYLKRAIVSGVVVATVVVLTACGSDKKAAQQAPAAGKSTAGLENYRPPKIDTAGLLAKEYGMTEETAAEIIRDTVIYTHGLSVMMM